MSDEWTGPEADLISAELARVVLGGRGPDRPEQEFTLRGVLTRVAIAASGLTGAMLRAVNAMQRVGEAVSRNASTSEKGKQA